MVAHGLITGMLFFIAGSVQHNYGTREMSRLGGLLKSGAEDGLDPRLLRDGEPRAARPRRLLGRVPGDPLGVQPRRAASAQPLFRFYMVVAAIGTVLAAGYLLWMLQKVAFGVPKAEFADAHIHDVSSFEWTAWIPILAADRRARHLPEHHLPRHRRAAVTHVTERRSRPRRSQ